MNSKEMWELLQSSSEEEIFNMIGIFMEYYTKVYNKDFNKVLKELKKLNKYVNNRNNC